MLGNCKWNNSIVIHLLKALKIYLKNSLSLSQTKLNNKPNLGTLQSGNKVKIQLKGKKWKTKMKINQQNQSSKFQEK